VQPFELETVEARPWHYPPTPRRQWVLRFRHSRVATRAPLRATIEKNMEGDKAIARYNKHDAPERVCTTADDALSPRIRLLHSETLEWLMALKSWIISKVIVLDESLFDRLSTFASAECDDTADIACS
jgi:hypothetical protein